MNSFVSVSPSLPSARSPPPFPCQMSLENDPDNTISPDPSPPAKRPVGGSTRKRSTIFQFSQACSTGRGSLLVFSHSATSSLSSSSIPSSSPPWGLLSTLSSSPSSGGFSGNPFLFLSSLANRSFLAFALAFSVALKVSMPVMNPFSGLARRRRASLHFRKASGAGSLYSTPNLAARARALDRSFSYSVRSSASVGTTPPKVRSPLPPYSVSMTLTNFPPSSMGTPSSPKWGGIDITATLRTLTSRALRCSAELPIPTYFAASTPDLSMSYMLSSMVPTQRLPGTLPTPALSLPPCSTIQYGTHASSAHTREGTVVSTHSW
mmetsp:Transcript_34294/g.73086  ORF Transcript_34294/g.73086 Transcript_34294/m.73086 type:complete len:321 (-) Transcript_34294:410-1372(-)